MLTAPMILPGYFDGFVQECSISGVLTMENYHELVFYNLAAQPAVNKYVKSIVYFHGFQHVYFE